MAALRHRPSPSFRAVTGAHRTRPAPWRPSGSARSAFSLAGLGFPGDHTLAARRWSPLMRSLPLALLAALAPPPVWAAPSAPLPAGVRAVWDLDGAWRETTPTR